MKQLKGLFLLLALLGAAPLFGGGSKETEPPKTTIEGALRLVGNEPFTRLVVVTKEGKNYFFETDKKKIYSRFIGLLVVARGTAEENVLKTADGRVLGTEYLLKNAEVKEAKPRDPPK